MNVYPVSRKLPSADWIALGVGVLGLLMSRFFQPLVGLTTFAVFAPSILRELGWLKDGDEFSRQIMYRASFHAVLILVLLFILNRVFHGEPGLDPLTPHGYIWAFPMDSLRQYLVLVFLLSYLIQYWGAVQGVFRILLGMALVTLIEVSVVFFCFRGITNGVPLAMAGVVILVVLLAFASRRWPVQSGYLLCVIALVSLGFSLLHMDDSPGEMVWPIINGAVLELVFFGITGLSLVLSSNEPME